MRDWWLLALLAAVCLWEMVAPRTALTSRRSLRWPTSFTLGPLNAFVGTFPLPAYALALTLREGGLGVALDHILPPWLTIAAAVCLLDLVGYVQHRILHAVPYFWTVHRVHHADVDFDYTTAFRFHPIEALFANAVVLVSVVALGLPPFAVLVHGAIASGITVLEHANARIPPTIESWIGQVFVTPAMHRVHHSAATPDTDSNFATIFSFWDQILGTYRPTAMAGAVTGLMEFRAPKYQTLPWVLAMPFLGGQRAGAAAVPTSARAEVAK
jgi:sterol desaturase/sphingolipid hydroxylase (fatty acid hydroxylase superfamily)